MPSLIPGYEYDIFISYRQKDNKGEKWVSEFVDALKDELESTFKEEISIYFDINPHDGLLETHDVDSSLKEKLKCLVFIPILSRTYCDPKSFAWEHELKEFVEQASQDKFGLKIRLPEGNSANRVLPVRIHDLEAADIRLFESVIDEVLHGIEFIYKSPGVNRPLRSKEEKPFDNTNSTIYRDQINKITLLIKEIISGLRGESDTMTGKEVPDKELFEKEKKLPGEPVKLLRSKLLSGVAILGILIIAVLNIWPKISNRGLLEKSRSSDGKISVAIMPFQNHTGDSLWDVWQDGIQNLLIISLSNSPELKVRQKESVHSLLQSKGFTNYASITPSIASLFSQKLDANVLINGSINKSGSVFRINAQLIDPRTEESFRSFQIEGTPDYIMQKVDSLSILINNNLLIDKIGKGISHNYLHLKITDSPQAYQYFILGEYAFQDGDFPEAVRLYSQALAIDTNFVLAERKIIGAYFNMSMFDEAKVSYMKVFRKVDRLPFQEKIYTNWLHAILFETPFEEIKYLQQLQQFDDQLLSAYTILGQVYLRTYQFDKAIPEFQKVFDLYKKWDAKPFLPYNYANLGYAYHGTKQYRKEERLYRAAEKDFPGDFDLIYLHTILYLTEGDTIKANQNIEKIIAMSKENSYDDEIITFILAQLYTEAGIKDKAEKQYRKLLSLQPDMPVYLNYLAYFLINNDRDIVEGSSLTDRALAADSSDFSFLHTKGWCLYKQGNYKEALRLLERSWELKPVYDHDLSLHLDAARKAVAVMR